LQLFLVPESSFPAIFRFRSINSCGTCCSIRSVRVVLAMFLGQSVFP